MQGDLTPFLNVGFIICTPSEKQGQKVNWEREKKSNQSDFFLKEMKIYRYRYESQDIYIFIHIYRYRYLYL